MFKIFPLSAFLFAFTSGIAIAQDYVAVTVEAEDYTQKNSLWRVFNNNSQPNVNPDPDGSHHSSASGRSYLELLPDTRVTHGDQLITGTNFWPVGGQGPSITYTVNFPQAGRYIVWAKAYSTGTEDNGIHVGINGGNPESGQRMQWCNGKNAWTWSSAQRATNNHCGTARTIYLDIPFAGANTITFSAREDGFELDQFMFIKENLSGLVCTPAANDNINCNRSASGSTSDGSNNSTPAPQPVEDTPASQPAEDLADEPEEMPAAASHPECTTAASDPDGDGYGWENDRTCISAGAGNTAQPVASGVPVCESASSDPDGDGWGWENNQSCQVSSSTTTGSIITDSTDGVQYCTSADSDSDGDGWGWESNQSCRVR